MYVDTKSCCRWLNRAVAWALLCSPLAMSADWRLNGCRWSPCPARVSGPRWVRAHPCSSNMRLYSEVVFNKPMIPFRHDFDERHGGNGQSQWSSNWCNGKGLMSYGSNLKGWSSCSNEDFKNWYLRSGWRCLESSAIWWLPLFYANAIFLSCS